MENILSETVNKDAWSAIFESFTPKQRRWAFIAVKMAEHKKSFKDIGTKHRLSGWFIGACAHGDRPMTARVSAAIESDLRIDLSPFLNPDEARKTKKGGAKDEPEEL